MKLVQWASSGDGLESPPTWGRGLKPYLTRCIARLGRVAPHVGAWIETLPPPLDNSNGDVAPHVGAWIETQVDN